MAGFLIAIISGALMSLQGAFNTNVTKASSVCAVDSTGDLCDYVGN
mgnify:CR=1 FL=1